MINKGEIRLIVSVFCYHNLGWSNTKWKLKQQLDSDEILKNIHLEFDYEIQNNIRFNNPRLNLAYPVVPQPEIVTNYLQSLTVTNYSELAYRKTIQPIDETFFSSQQNRNRFENILLLKGVNIINQIKNLNVRGIRPLGYTIGSHKTYGLGTLFFLWRNIPNNCPLVFGWSNPAHNWEGLFPVVNRGL